MNRKTTIHIPYPDDEILHLSLALGACRMRVWPGDGPEWVTGTYTDASEAAPLRIERNGGDVKISQDFRWPGELDHVTEPPIIELVLGKGRPFSLSIEGGASDSTIDAGGVPLSGLEIKYGAGHQRLDFSAPNPQSIEKIAVATGAASVEMTHLANANFAHMVVEGGAANVALDFGGRLVRDGEAKLTLGMAALEMHVPFATAARVHTDTVLAGLDVGNGWMKQEGAFHNEAVLSGREPALNISAHVVMGGIRLVTD